MKRSFILFIIIFFLLTALSSVASVASVASTMPASIEIIDSHKKVEPIHYAGSMEEMLLFFDERELIITATKQPQNVADAPAIATIITAEDIRRMGARDIMDVLNRVPGMHVFRGYYGKENIEVRGIVTINSEKVKIMIDGHSLNNLLLGGTTYAFDSLSVDNVKRIEVVRGPGSALYGSNAFSAVINIITKDGKDMDGVIFTAAGGSYDTGKVNLQAGKKWDELDIASSVDYYSTYGARLNVDSDILGNSGKTRDGERKLEAAFKAKYKGISFNSKYVTKREESYIGVGNALNDETEERIDQFFGELVYGQDFSLGKITSRLYWDEFHFKVIWEIYPEGANVPNLGIFPYGMIGVPSLKSRTKGAELQFDFDLTDSNILTLGGLWENYEAYDLEHHANYNPAAWTYYTDGNVRDVGDIRQWNQEKKRYIGAAYLQDVWDITAHVNVTAGIRYDDYSDVGSTSNPRAAFVWRLTEKWHLKLLYGSAFRAPSFEELHNINNPVVLGNSNLAPEKMTTYEVSFVRVSKETSTATLTYFHNRFRDRIQLVPQSIPSQFAFENRGGATIQGIEFEYKRDLSKGFSAYLNYTHQDSEDNESKRNIANIAYNKGNIGFNAKAGNYIDVNTNIFVSGKRSRHVRDGRSELPEYALVDLAVIGKNFIENFELRLSVHNLLGKKYEDPAPIYYDDIAGEWKPTIRDDYPREGMSALIEGRYKF
ncbi:MAG: TonB-dependent receptor [Deltaproteobacteria bacterium]|nr:TonB-dependent receptor [Deltaproteobacteria bacterium]